MVTSRIILIALLLTAVPSSVGGAQPVVAQETPDCGPAFWAGNPEFAALRSQLAEEVGCDAVEALDALVESAGTASLEQVMAFTSSTENSDECVGEVVIQRNPSSNQWGCGSCVGNVIIQVGLSNTVECGNGCIGNVMVQVGLGNAIFCYIDSSDTLLETLANPGGTLPEQNLIVKIELPASTFPQS